MTASKEKVATGDLGSLSREFLNYLKYAGANGLVAGESGGSMPSSAYQASTGEAGDSLEKIAAEISSCRLCRLCRSRTRAVPGEGPVKTDLMVIGEGPGVQEDRTGKPFVGEAGRLLTRMLQAIDEPRPTVFITNVVKCRPPGNRNPAPDEIEACRPFLERQKALIRPLVILSLGKVASQVLLDTDKPISRIRGTIFEVGGAGICPTFHPAYLLRNPDGKAPVWEDLKQLRRKLSERRRRLP